MDLSAFGAGAESHCELLEEEVDPAALDCVPYGRDDGSLVGCDRVGTCLLCSPEFLVGLLP